jgi:hypothetical protein
MPPGARLLVRTGETGDEIVRIGSGVSTGVS